MAEVLLIDDDPGVVKVVERALRQDAHVVLSASDGPTGLQMARRHSPDLIIVDVMMPRMSGWEVCEALRGDPLLGELPIIFLTAQDSPGAQVDGLDLGAHDYVTKPFDVDVLRARVRAALRAHGSDHDDGDRADAAGGLRLAPDGCAAIVNGRHVELTPTEHDLLRMLLSPPGEVFSVDALLQRVWGYPPGTGEGTLVRRYVHSLRNKLEDDPSDPRLLITVRGRGYVIATQAARDAGSQG
ncbi:MAG: response regulator transcription factor [Armatimonadota bacterium]